jgi:hypothetical protein
MSAAITAGQLPPAHAHRYTQKPLLPLPRPSLPPSLEPHTCNHVNISAPKTSQPTTKVSSQPRPYSQPPPRTTLKGSFQVEAAEPPRAGRCTSPPSHQLVWNADIGSGCHPAPSTGPMLSANSVSTLGEFCWVRQSPALQTQIGQDPTGLPLLPGGLGTSMSMELAQLAWHHWLGFPGKAGGYPGWAWHRLASAPGQTSDCPDRESRPHWPCVPPAGH